MIGNIPLTYLKDSCVCISSLHQKQSPPTHHGWSSGVVLLPPCVQFGAQHKAPAGTPRRQALAASPSAKAPDTPHQAGGVQKGSCSMPTVSEPGLKRPLCVCAFFSAHLFLHSHLPPPSSSSHSCPHRPPPKAQEVRFFWSNHIQLSVGGRPDPRPPVSPGEPCGCGALQP